MNASRASGVVFATSIMVKTLTRSLPVIFAPLPRTGSAVIASLRSMTPSSFSRRARSCAGLSRNAPRKTSTASLPFGAPACFFTRSNVSNSS
jgi:hypothetical protein